MDAVGLHQESNDDPVLFTAVNHDIDNAMLRDSDSRRIESIPEKLQGLSSRDDAAPNHRSRSTRKRHGACNQHKMKHFVKWLYETFFNEHPAMSRHILDVAGGKGELAARLTMCHGLKVTMVDPRPADVASVYIKDVVPRLPSKWQERLKERTTTKPNVVRDTLRERFQQLVLYFTDETVVDDEALASAIQACSFITGVHADSATECIVNVALRHGKPFVVIPCCVFPNVFQQRYLTVYDEDDNDTGCSPRTVPVRSCEQFCEYLLQKDSRFRKSILPFEGRNVAIWWDGKG